MAGQQNSGPADSPGKHTADAELVRALRTPATHQAAAREILRRFGPVVSGVLRRALGSDDVADLMQEVFLRFFARPHALEQPEALRAFLMQIVFNVIRHEARRRKVRRLVRLGRDPQPPESPVDPDLGARELAGRLQAVLAKLPTRDRMVFLLRYVERMPIAEVAVSLRMPPSTTKHVALRVQAVVLRAFEGEPLAQHLAFRRSREGLG